MRWLDRLLKKKPEHPLRVAGAGHLYPAQPTALSALIQAVRDQTRLVDLKQVNRVLLQPHWRKNYDRLDEASQPIVQTLPGESEGR